MGNRTNLPYPQMEMFRAEKNHQLQSRHANEIGCGAGIYQQIPWTKQHQQDNWPDTGLIFAS